MSTMQTTDRPFNLATGLVVFCVALAWLYLFLMTANMAKHMDLQELGPGMGVLESVFCSQAQCGSESHHHAHNMASAQAAWSISELKAILVMWWVMVVAMMLPTVIPALKVLHEINQSARIKQLDSAPLIGFIVGYLAIWIAISVFASLGQWGLQQTPLMNSAMISQNALFSGVVLLLAGAYQFSRFKEKCLTQCRMPMTFFIANWREKLPGAFHMGLRHGAICVGCCIGLMIVMFVVGLMNLVWIAVLGLIMLTEKVMPYGKQLASGAGYVLCACGVLLIASDLT